MDKLLEEAEEIIKRESFFEYIPGKHRKQLKKMIKKGDGGRNPRFFDPWMRIFKGGEKEHPSSSKKVKVLKIGDIAYIALEDFLSFGSLIKFRVAVRKAACAGDPVIIDLRDNRGGFLSFCFEMAVLFSKSSGDDILIAQRYKNKKEEATRVEDIRVEHTFNPFRGKLVVLVNEWSASASEVFVGILKQWGFPVVGEKTYGKGVSQDDFPLSDGSTVRTTISEVFVGNNRLALHKVGIEPDYYVRDNRKIFRGLTGTKKDRQFMKAVEVLKKMK